MPVRGTCLLNDTPLKEALFDVIEFSAYDRLRSGKKASLGGIHSDLRKAGVEVDLPTVGEIYNDVLPRDDANFDSDVEIDDYVTRTYNDAIQKLVELNTLVGEKQIGDQKPETATVEFLLKALYDTMVDDQRTTSDMKALQTALWNGMKRMLGKTDKTPPTKKTMAELIEESLGWERMGVEDVTGRINSIEDLFNAMQEELSNTKYEIMGRAEDEAIIDRFNEYIKNLENATYNLLFREKDALQVRDDALKNAGFGKTLKNGKTILDWNKLAAEIGSVADLRANAHRAFEQAGFSEPVIERLKDTLQQEFIDLRAEIIVRADKELQKRESQLSKDYIPKKTDIQRMVELYHLGIFNRAHDKLLYNLVGVNNLQAEDIADLEQLANAASDLSRKVVDINGYNLTNDQFVSRRFQFIQRLIDSIVQRNISNKSKTLTVLREITRYLDLMLTGLLALPTTIVQNIFSGARAVATGARVGFDKEWASKSKQSLQLYGAMIAEVTKTGQTYGEEIGSFATRELFSNTLRWKWGEGLLGEGTTLKDKARSLLFALTIPSRIGLLAFDSANKVALTNKIFYNMIYNSLIKRGIEKGIAFTYMNEMLYGESFDDAKKMARRVIEENNNLLKPEFRSKVTNAEIITLANDIVKANLNTSGGIVGTDVLTAALKGSYHVAGLGLGHEPNNYFSRFIKTGRDALKNEEQRLIKDKDWYGLGIHRVKSGLLNNFVIRFAGGATNWLWLRAKEGLGIGLLTGGAGMAFSRDVDFSNAETLQRQMREREKARNDFARGLVGVAYNALAYAIGFAVVGGGSDDDDEEKLATLKAKKNKTVADGKRIAELEETASIYRRIKNDVGKDRWFRVLAPDLMLLQYYTANSRTGTFGEGMIKYAERTYNGNDRFSVTGKLHEAGELFSQGDNEGGWGVLASIAGDRVTVPFWRATKDYYRVVANAFRKDDVPPSRYEPATTFMEGLFGGGLAEDLGIFKRDSRITMIPGVGIKAYNRFKKLGIEKMDDLTEGWWNKRDKDGVIMQADERARAKRFYEQYKKE